MRLVGAESNAVEPRSGLGTNILIGFSGINSHIAFAASGTILIVELLERVRLSDFLIDRALHTGMVV